MLHLPLNGNRNRCWNASFVTVRRKITEFRYRKAFCKGTATKTGVGMRVSLPYDEKLRNSVTARRFVRERQQKPMLCMALWARTAKRGIGQR